MTGSRIARGRGSVVSNNRAWTCPGCGRRYDPLCSRCPRCALGHDEEVGIFPTSPWRRPESPLRADSPDPDLDPAPPPDRRPRAVLAARDPVGWALRLVWGGVAVVVLLGTGWLVGWHMGEAPVRSTVQWLDATQRQMIADGASVPTAQAVAMPTVNWQGPLQSVTVRSVSLPVPTGWHVQGTAIDVGSITTDAVNAITIDHLHEHPLIGGGFEAWGLGPTGLYWIAELPLPTGAIAEVTAVP